MHDTSLLGAREVMKYARFGQILFNAGDFKNPEEVVLLHGILSDLKLLGASTFLFQYSFFTTEVTFFLFIKLMVLAYEWKGFFVGC